MSESTLQLKPRGRAPGTGRTPREFLDFVVDGSSLLDALGGLDLVGCLGWGDPAEQEKNRARLLLREPPPLSAGRVPLYVCGECGDIACGAVTAKVERTPTAFVWSDFGMESGDGSDITRYPKWQHLGPFSFNKALYWQALQGW